MSDGKAPWAAAALLAFTTGAACAAGGSTTLAARDLVDLSLEQLSNVVVTSVSRREQPLAGAAASIYVITGDDIRRSGATSLPEALRLAPNLQVARVDASQYAITARGFNGTIANKLLVLIDGRTVTSPLFSGTFWEAQDVLLEDVERIEVISGPGATLWGANAVNGVINVITRSASATQGNLVVGGAGSDERRAAMRHGGTLRGGHYRVYAKAARRDATALADGTANRDQADHAQAGFRADWQSGREGFTLQGDAYGGDLDQAPEPREISGLNLLGRWTRDLGEGAQLRVQGYYDRTFRHRPGNFKEHLDSFDFDLQHGLKPAGDHRVLWGAGLRHHRDRVENVPASGLAFQPAERDLNEVHVFVQDEIRMREGLHLTLGAKAERNSYTGAEFLPSARFALQLAPDHVVWAAASRAVRAPARLDREIFTFPPPPGIPVMGGPNFVSEVAKVVELGYRAQPSRRLSWSVTAFHQDYEHLRTLSPAPGGAVIANDLEGSTSGFESWASWRGADWWRVDAGLVRLDRSLRLRPGAVDLQSSASVGSDPEGWWKLRAAFDLGADYELDFMARHYGALENRDVPAYTALDARLAWHAARGLEVSLVLENLFDDEHVEWGPPPGQPLVGAQFGRAAFLKLRFEL